MTRHSDLIGIGIGPFHLSLAALLSKNQQLRVHFFDQRPQFEWHPELMFSDAQMQTSFLKDLVTPVDPTNHHSFLNYLVQNGLFYSFMNTTRRVVSRKEFELYCQWVSKNLSACLNFNSTIESVDYDGEKFFIKSNQDTYTSTHLSIATGLAPKIPECALPYIGPRVFHAKSKFLKDLNLNGLRVLIVGGGQTGVEIFRNALKGNWGRPKSIKLISRRQNLEPLDESPFTNEYFHPSYVKDFFSVDEGQKESILKLQKLSSDGNTPDYLEKLYNELYYLQNVSGTDIETKILPRRDLVNIQMTGESVTAIFENSFLSETEMIEADILILSTGFKVEIPPFLNNLKHLIFLDHEGRFILDQNFSLRWNGQKKNNIYALNFSRHRHGIAEPQTSLMAWRSAVIINDLLNENYYKTDHHSPRFIQYGK